MKFSIRDLLWLTVVVALGLGWWVDRGRLLSRVERAEKTADFVTLLHTPPLGPFIDEPSRNSSAPVPKPPSE